MNVHHKFIMKSIFNQSFALQSSRSSSQVVFFPALLGDTFATGLYRFIWLPASSSFCFLRRWSFGQSDICTFFAFAVPVACLFFSPSLSATDVLQIEFLPRDTLSDRLPTAFGI